LGVRVCVCEEDENIYLIEVGLTGFMVEEMF
jgi:hypothetical protein